jgi:hypothetical protein
LVLIPEKSVAAKSTRSCSELFFLWVVELALFMPLNPLYGA